MFELSTVTNVPIYKNGLGTSILGTGLGSSGHVPGTEIDPVNHLPLTFVADSAVLTPWQGP